jgi:tRNA-guanine family transglycosylase
MGELSAHRLLTIHNLRYTMDLIGGARAAIEAGRLGAFRDEVAFRRDGSAYREPGA